MGKNQPHSPADEELAHKPELTSSTRLSLIGLLALLLAVVIGSTVRIHTAVTDANFDTQNPRPLLRSDPALLYYFTERIIESGGLPPVDFRADPYVEHPETSDLPAMFSISQEFLIAWCALLFGTNIPLHVLCVLVMGIFASLAVVGVYGLTIELTRNVRWGILATAMYLVIEGNYRTIGFVLIREDFSMPWFALHLFLLARAVRVKTKLSFALAAITLVLAACSWQAMGFIISIEVACIFAWFLRTGQNPLATRGAWLAPLLIAVFALIIPVLSSKLFILSIPMQMIFCLLLLGPVSRKWNWSSIRTRIVGVVMLPVMFMTSLLASRHLGGGLGDYSHVFELLKAKIQFLGKMPQDPSKISFDSRLLWQGPFQTANFNYFLGALGVGLMLIFAVIGIGSLRWFSGKGDTRVNILFALFIAGAVSAVLVQRTIIIPALIAPIVAVIVLRMLPPGVLRITLISVMFLYQIILFSGFIRYQPVVWYLPPIRNEQLAMVIDWIEKNIPEGEPVAADFVSSSAILAHTRHPIVQQPKYETTRSRRRIEEFMMTFAHQSPAEFRKLLNRYQCRYVLVDRGFWMGSAYTVGINTTLNRDPPPGSAYAELCSQDQNVLTHIPGYRLLYRSPQGYQSDWYRVFVLE